jgi:hypothetical protein
MISQCVCVLLYADNGPGHAMMRGFSLSCSVPSELHSCHFTIFLCDSLCSESPYFDVSTGQRGEQRSVP